MACCWICSLEEIGFNLCGLVLRYACFQSTVHREFPASAQEHRVERSFAYSFSTIIIFSNLGVLQRFKDSQGSFYVFASVSEVLFLDLAEMT